MHGSITIKFLCIINLPLILNVLILIIAVVGLPGNLTVLWLLGFRMRRNAISVYILHLSGADFLLLCCRIIESLMRIIFIHIFHYSNYISIYYVFQNVVTIPYISGLGILSAISIERCLSVLWPIWYHCRRPRNMSAVICALMWVLSLIMSILDWHYSGFLSEFSDQNWWEKVDFIIAAWLIILFIALSGSSLALMVKILCGSRPRPLTRLYVTILLTVLVFLICGLPFGLYWFLSVWFHIYFYHNFRLPYEVTVVLSCVNSCANPIIYFCVGSFSKRQQYKNFKTVLQRALQDTPELDECGGSHPPETFEMSGSRVEQ
uniref:G-protein coupled receptors family 1 profile domain-containing protein n=1 Tax=Castor canadensis TaxID=51338 RepID=A0A8C0WBK2_CASCN